MGCQAIRSTSQLAFPFACDSPFLFAVHHLDHYPRGTANLGPERSLLASRSLGADFGHPSGWSMYHGDEVPGFPRHPHRGFETITLARRGYCDHSDSLGNGGRFGGGDVQWMTAGAGVQHAEMFPLLNQHADNTMELFQIWINLPRRSKMAQPSFKMLWAESIPTKCIEHAGRTAEVSLITGTLDGWERPPDPPPQSYASDPESAVMILTIKLTDGASWTLPSASSAGVLHRNLYFFAGTGALIIDGRKLTSHSRITMDPAVAAEIAAEGGNAELLLLQGREIEEPVVQHGPFVGNSQQDIIQAFSDYQRSQFGGWPWDSDAPVFPRDQKRFAKYADGRLEEKEM